VHHIQSIAGGSTYATIDSTGVAGVGYIYVTPVTAPSTPTGKFIIFMDTADKKLKALGSSGTTTVLAVP